ncbi:tetratricopeptide (TPR) repeat protein [Allocatelliglobosispora scoriae]|uniref:Tetratricopeptide (TPR) repeat protein n=1 Tax=Allocatelliglobosispora scoriae TaxID=643052 RepID=A0A841BUB7_9ACTN|nr:hypothetical protein [Allocatelliglobosispora scoriae]MBB5871036.1 tetratricopeptide (TPR) repeat protein [Allocatelliglobosispora scoriae]
MTTSDDVREMISKGWGTPDGRGRIAIAEESVRHAEALGDSDLAFAARMLATTAYHQGGEPAKAFVTFARCLAQYDADPGSREEADESLLLWHFKFVTGALPRFPELPLQRTYAVLDDMERRYRQGGHSLHAVYAYRQRVARHLGDVALADHFYRLWDTAPRDGNSDCVGCDPTSKVYYLTWRERYADAVALAEPVLTGRLTCAEQPQEILTSLLVPYLRTGQLDKARDAHRRAYRALAANPANLGSVAVHIDFCALTGNEVRGLELIERHLTWLERAPSPLAEMSFAASAAAVLRRLAASGQGDLAVRRGGDSTTAAALGEELANRAIALAVRFDERNGNTYQSSVVAETLNVTPLVDYLPLSITARQRGSVAAVPVEPVVPVPAVVDLSACPETLPLDEQLELAEKWRFDDDEDRAHALWRRIEEQHPESGMTDVQRGRMARSRAYRTPDSDEGAAAEFELAATLFAAAGDDVREFSARGQLALARFRMKQDDEHLTVIRQTTDFLLRNSDDDDVRRGALMRLAYALAIAGVIDEALTTLEELDAFAGPVPVRRRAQEQLMRAQLLAGLERFDESLAASTSVVESLDGTGPSNELAAARVSRAKVLGMNGDHRGALAEFEAAAKDAIDPELRRSAWLDAAFMLVGTDRAAEVIDDIVEHICQMVEVGEDRAAAYSRHRLAVALATIGRQREAAEVAEEALSWFADHLEEQAIADECRELLGQIYINLGEPTAALDQLDQLAANLNGYDNLGSRAAVLERTADILYRIDRDREASDRFAEAGRAYRDAGYRLSAVRTARRRMTSLHYSQQPEAALAQLAEVEAELNEVATTIDTDGQPQLLWERAMTGYDAAFMLANSDDHVGALRRIEPAAALFRSIEAFEEALLAELREGEILVAAGAADRGEAVLRRVLDGLPEDHRARQETAWWLARALDEQGEQRKARKLRKDYDLPDPE